LAELFGVNAEAASQVAAAMLVPLLGLGADAYVQV
jgi:hypothetical protein